MQQGPKPVLDAKLGRRIGTTPRLPQNPFSAPVGVTFPGVNASGTQRPGRHPAQISPLGGCQSRCLSSAPITVEPATHRQHRPPSRNPICRWSKDEMGRRASSMRGPKTPEAPPSGMTSAKPISPTSPAEPHVWLTNMVKDQHGIRFRAVGLPQCQVSPCSSSAILGSRPSALPWASQSGCLAGFMVPDQVLRSEMGTEKIKESRKL